MKTCGKCGLQAEDAVNFCPNCGERLTPQQAAPSDSAAAQNPTPVAPPVTPPPTAAQNPFPAPPPSAPTPPPIAPPPAGNAASAPQGNFAGTIQTLNNTTDETAGYDQADIKNNTLMAALSYIGILVLIPMFAAKESPFARFHVNQGFLLFVCEIAYGVVQWIIKEIFFLIFGGFAYWIYKLVSILLSIIGLVFLAVSIVGIVNAVNGKAKELPLIGKYRVVK